MAYKYQKGDATLSGSVTIEESLTVSSATTLSGLLSSSAKISGSAFYGSGAALTGITADSFEVDDTNANTEFKLVGVASTGTGVTLVAMNDGNFPAYNASTGKVTIKGAQEVDGALQVDGASTLSHLTASKGGLFSDNISMAASTDIAFAANGNLDFGSATTGNSGLKMADNLASAFDIHQGGNSYLKFTTTNSGEQVVIGKDLDVDGAATLNGNVTLGDAASDVITVSGHLTASKGGKFVLGVDCDSTLNVDGALTANGTVTLGNAVSDVTTVTGYLTASKGIRLSNVSWIAANTDFQFSGEGGSAKIKGDGSNNLNLMGANLITNAAAFYPESAGGADIGKSGTGWGSIYLADDKKIIFGNGDDASIEYDENGTDELRFAGAAVTFEQAVTFDANVTLGNAASDVTTVTGHLTASKGGLFSDNVQIATGKELKFVGNAAIDMSSAATGNAYISMADNLGEAFFFAEGANTYMTFVTTNSSEAVVAGKDLKVGGSVGTDVFLSLYSGVEYHGQELVTADKTISDLNRTHYICSGSAVVTLTLPAAETGYSAFVKRHPSMTANVKVAANGSEKIDGVTTDLVLETAGAAVQLVASGSAWYVY